MRVRCHAGSAAAALRGPDLRRRRPPQRWPSGSALAHEILHHGPSLVSYKLAAAVLAVVWTTLLLLPLLASPPALRWPDYADSAVA